MPKGEERKKAVFPSPLPFRRPEDHEERKWPSPTPLPTIPTENTGKMLKQILKRLDAIEKRLERIEKMLATNKPPL